MELYSMPQLDKVSPYSDIHYVERSDLSNTSIPVDVKKFSPVSEDILTNSAWSAVIHRPAEDSEPEDLPSTVDMDAIKGSPSTSLPTSAPMTWIEAERSQGDGGGGDDDSESGDDDEDDEDEDDDDEDDDDEDGDENGKVDSSSENESSSPNSDGDDADSESGTAQGSASDSDSESSSKNSYDSDSDSASSDSSCSSRSSESSESRSPTPKLHSWEQKKQEHIGSKPRLVPHLNDSDDKSEHRNDGVPAEDDQMAEDRRGMLKKDDEKHCRKEGFIHHVKDERMDQRLQGRQEAIRNPARVKVEADENREKLKDAPPKSSPLKSGRRKDTDAQGFRASNKAKSSVDEVSSTRPSVGSVSTTALAPHAFKSTDEKKSERRVNTSIPSSTTQKSALNSVGHESSSDVELPDQVVSDAIKRIQIESKSGPSTPDHEVAAENDEDEESSDDGGGNRQAQYSSSLLQKFVERTERLSGKRSHPQAHARTSGSKHNTQSGTSYAQKEALKRKHGHCGKVPLSSSVPVRSVEGSLAAGVKGGPADLEVYCSVSNVSPDSGIYCVNGSPWHQSSPAHSPQHPPHLKTLPSPPHGVNPQHRRKHVSSLKAEPASSSKSKKSSSHLDHLKDVRVPPILSIDNSDDETTSSSPLLSAPARRGRGRPKKAPPILEPCLPYGSKDSSKQMYSLDRSQGKNRKPLSRKESESSDQSVERCDKILSYSTHRNRGVQVTSQGVQCDQSEFPQIRQSESKKKKKNQGSQSHKMNLTKSTSVYQASTHSGLERGKSLKKLDTLQAVCDRVKKTVEKSTYGLGPGSQSKSFSTSSAKDGGTLKRTSLFKQDSSSLSCNQSSSSKRRLQTSTERRKKGRRRGHAARLAAVAAALLSSSSPLSAKAETVIGNMQPASSVSTARSSKTRPAEKVVALPKGLKSAHHKHKKHHRRKEHKKNSSCSSYMDPRFLQELEKLIEDFQRSCCIARIQQPSRLTEGTRLPSIFRLRRIGKKRKGSERSKNSDKDSGPEGESPPTVTPALRDTRDKGSTGGKRRPKKSAVETPKGQRPEANNEQRLPLKKRHYHMSTAPNQQSALTSSPEMSLDVSSSAEEKRSNNDDSPTSSVSSKNSLMSSTSQGSRGNPPLSTPNLTNKTGLLMGTPNTNAQESSTASTFVACTGKAANSFISNVNNRLPVTSACPVKGNICTGANASTKVTIVMPATSSCPLPTDFPSSEPSIFKKANSSASFASVCGKQDSTSTCVPVSNLEKGYSSSVSGSSRLCGPPAISNRNSPPGTSSASNFTSSVSSDSSLISSKQIQLSVQSVSESKPSSACNNSKVLSSKSSSSALVKTVTGPTALTAPVKSVADSSLLMKSTSDVNHLPTEDSSDTSSPILNSLSSSSSKNLMSSTIAQNYDLVQTVVKNSYDEAIEACISKYSSDPSSPHLAHRSVITTPKKRHRMEMQGKSVGGKGKELETSVHSTTTLSSGTQPLKRSQSRTPSVMTSSPLTIAPEVPQPFVQTKLTASLPAPQVLSPGGSQLPDSGIFEPSSSVHYVVDVSLPATPVKSAIAGLSKLKGTPNATCFKPVASPSPILESTSVGSSSSNVYALTCHNLRQKKNILALSSADEPENVMDDTSSLAPVKLDTEVELPSKIESDSKAKTKPKSKSKQADSSVKSENLNVKAGEELEVKREEKEHASEVDNVTASEWKELRVHVEKLSSSDISLQKDTEKISKQKVHLEKLCSSETSSLIETEKISKQPKVVNAVPKRRRKCNRTGFPVKRKRKKKEMLEAGRAKVDESIPVVIDSTPEPDDCAMPLKDEFVVKVENKQENQAVILKAEPFTINAKESEEIKQEAKSLELCNVANLDVQANSQHCAVKSGDELPLVPYTDRMPNKEKYMFSGFTKRLDAKQSKIRKPSKAVIRAMRAKFSENISLPDMTAENPKGTKLVPSHWSSEESEDSLDDPYECSDARDLPLPSIESTEMIGENLEAPMDSEICDSIPKLDHNQSLKKSKRDMKRPAFSSVDEPIKSKCAKSEKDGHPSATRKPKASSNDSRTRSKRKNEAPGELRCARSKKRFRVSRRTEVDSVETDCDESVLGETLPPIAGGTGDALSEDEVSKTDLKDAKQPRWRKKFLPAGLFSDYFKVDEPRSGNDSKKGLQYKPEDHPHGLLPAPYHCGKWLRQRRVNFQLPYDLWWLHTHNKLPGRDIVPSWNYKKIRTNVYNNVKPSNMHEPQSCNCKSPDNGGKGCGDDCINRLVYAECSPSLCPLRDLCSNQKIQRHEWAPGLERFMTKEKGWGVRAKQAIKNGEFILEYVGEVVSDREFKERMATIYTQDTHHYCLHLDGGLVIDGHRMGGDGRFVNHSCEPNCEMQKWSVNGLFRMALFALRDIDANEELGYDYNFSLFNAAEGQPCKCGSAHCRGVIGGKSQRVNVLPSSQNGSSSKVSVEDLLEKKGSRKNKRKTNRKNDKEQAAENMRQRKRMEAQRLSQMLTLNIKQMSHQQRSFVRDHHCFLLRNLEKVRRLKEKLKQATQRAEGSARPAPSTVKQSDVFLTQLNALSIPRNVRTRRLAQAEDNPELARNARLACVLRDLFNVVVSAKDETGEALSSPFMNLPNKRKLPLYYVRIREPLDFSTVEQNINSGFYSTVEAFDQDISKILNNNLRFYGRTTNLGIASVRLKKVYLDAKKDKHPQLVDVLGETLPASFVAEKNPAEEEDVIRCICGLYRDEGMMIQCERCLVWQHCDCVRSDSTVERYLCEICEPRAVDLEIVMDPQPPEGPEGQVEHVTLLRSDLQIRQGDTVYVLRDVTEGEGEAQAKVTYKTIKDPKYGDMDIFRIERLWKDANGDRFAYGHHYLRPHETYHEPTRKFYPNEVMRVPLYEIIPLDLIWARCWVLDPMTYCKGRPIEAVEEHVYICEYRVDKSARLFYKISKSQSRANLCLKTYAFESFENRLKPVRTYTPHGPVPPLKPRVRGNQDDSSSTKSMQQSSSMAEEEEEVPLARVRDSAIAEKREKQQKHLNDVLLRLLANQQCKQPLDMSHLLDRGRRPRKKPGSLNT